MKLSGTITNYRSTRIEASFVFADNDRRKLGVVAVAAGIAGLGGQAIASAANALVAEEDADYVQFDLSGKLVKAWLWRSPFKDGDSVDVAAEWRVDHYEAIGIARPKDKLIALYPHCSRGKSAHIKIAIKWWIFGVAVWLVFLAALPLTLGVKYFFHMLEDFQYVVLGSYAFFGIMTFSLARKWMPFVRLAEKVFRTLGLPDPGNVDLIKSSRAQRRPDDPGEFGTFYFRY